MISVSESLYAGEHAQSSTSSLVGGRPQLVRGARRDHDAIPGDDVALVGPETHAAAASHEVIDLLAYVVAVLQRLSAGADRRLGEALVARLRPRRPGQLPDRRAVERDKALDLGAV